MLLRHIHGEHVLDKIYNLWQQRLCFTDLLISFQEIMEILDLEDRKRGKRDTNIETRVEGETDWYLDERLFGTRW